MRGGKVLGTLVFSQEHETTAPNGIDWEERFFRTPFSELLLIK